VSAVRPGVAARRARGGREGAQVPWWVSLALVPARVVLAVVIVLLRPPPSAEVLARIGRWGQR
jgi:hypothetical protein